MSNKLDRRSFIKTLSCTAAGLALSGCTNAAAKTTSAGKKPNIIFIMLDDLGPEWVSCYGADKIVTPNIDKLAADGMRFTNAYSMPKCTPTRVTLLTGQYPYNSGWINHWDVPRWGAG
ncbi:MAG: sulfatase-like hydrolase/transferase, partial [Anaerohalosphaera sp.]|nr:sulfatase-like hydrolase/transferase [Anaerohalosphaera sp.]